MRRIESASSKSKFHCKQPWHKSQYDEWKFNVETEYDEHVKDTIHDMEFEEVHRKWDEEHEVWEMDLDKLWHIIDHMNDAGVEVTIDDDVIRAYEEEVLDG